MYKIETVRERYIEEQRPIVVREPRAEDLNRLISVTGVTGCGKDYLLERSGLVHPQVSFGTTLARHLALNRDEIRNQTPFDALIAAQNAAADEILQSGPTVVNSHIFVKHGGFHMVNRELEHRLRPFYYVAVLADPTKIAAWRLRRQLSGSRVSALETPEEIAFHQNMVVHTIDTLSEEIGTGFMLVWNDEGTTDVNTSSIGSLVKQL